MIHFFTAAARAASASSSFQFRIDGPAFVDSLQYMAKGLLGIFLVTGVLVLCMVLLQKTTAHKKK